MWRTLRRRGHRTSQSKASPGHGRVSFRVGLIGRYSVFESLFKPCRLWSLGLSRRLTWPPPSPKALGKRATPTPHQAATGLRIASLSRMHVHLSAVARAARCVRGPVVQDARRQLKAIGCRRAQAWSRTGELAEPFQTRASIGAKAIGWVCLRAGRAPANTAVLNEGAQY